PVRAGSTYLVGERGPELVTFPQAGFVHDALKTARIMRNAALASSAMAVPAAAAPTLPMPTVPGFDLSSLQAAGSGGQQAGAPAPSIRIASGAVTISVQAAPGQSPEQIAEAVERMLSAKLNALGRGA